MVIDSLSFLIKAMTFLLILSSTGPLLLLLIAALHHLYIILHFISQLSSIVRQGDIRQLVHKSLLHQKFTLLREIMYRLLS